MLDIKTTTRELSIKITFIVFVFFVVFFLSLIFLHHHKFLYSEKKNLVNISNIVKKDPLFLIKALEIRCKANTNNCETLREFTKDFLVLKSGEVIFTRWIYDFMDLDSFIKNYLEEWVIYKLNINEREFYVIRIKYDYYDIYFTRDISFHSDYEKSLIFIFIVLSFVISIFIYLFAYQLANISLTPLKNYNESLKLYNHHIAHELKTPLSVLKSDLELLKIWYDKETVESSLEEIDNMKSVIDSMLFLSENVILKDKNKINLYELVDEMIDFYSNKSWKKINLIKKTKKELILSWDKNLIKTMLKNLFENAIKYSNGNEINIELSKNSIEFSNFYDFEIKEELKSKLFEAFYKLNFDSNSFWLWLSIVKKIVELHSFKIYLDIKDKIFKIKIEF